ncbi:hypothetical protein B0J13DRAFT_620047 [Dactylonectria estremocensis]|uniref:Uncharacterized protein n=1 Tax=Dactylonectria estremocensis TaxID=1079267 RepID=A0A9P9F101_9HYPO|nr:hypothetical protein B0J13DRAFT_620047 [Dactylonectria estremocensis]
MRLSVAFAALCAIPALSLATGQVDRRDPSVERNHVLIHGHAGSHHHHGHHHGYPPKWPHHKQPHPYHHHEEHKHKHKHPKLPCHKEHKRPKCHKGCKKPHCQHVHKHPHHPHHPHHAHHHAHLPHHHHKEHHHKEHKHVEDKALTVHVVCDKLNCLATKIDDIAHFIKGLECGYDDKCWKKVKDALYELEFELDIFDTKIDKSDLSKCFTCTEESKIACCYHTYADALIRLLRLIKHKSEHLDGEIDKYVLTAVNSLRAADSTFVYELGRRSYCEGELKRIMLKQGAVDGTTQGSIHEAFSKFIFTPLITGEHFKDHKHHGHHEHRHRQ